jgi:hypothetical protein
VRVEVLLTDDLAERGRRMLEAMIAAAPAAGIEPVVSPKGYRGDCELLMAYGTGHPIRRPYWQRHRRAGRRCIGWDLGYWSRAGDGFSMRATIDDDHPPRLIRPEPAERWEAAGIELREDADPRGPIMLVGMGIKAARLHAGQLLAWETRRLAALRQEFPGRAIIFRPKRPGGPPLRGAALARPGPIEEALRGCSLVVCRHSNVAVDACIAGIPVRCDDGAALALYARGPAPTRDERLGFLRSLAWWQWKPEEAFEAWRYLKGRIQCG